jgi:hypothetical protein
MAGIGYADVERICDDFSELLSLDVAASQPGCVRVRGRLRLDGDLEDADTLSAFQQSAHSLVDALARAGWCCVETKVDFSIGTEVGARWAGHYRLALERQA